MRSVSAIIIINLAYVCGWDHLFPTKGFDRAVLKDLDTEPSPSYNVTIHTLWQPYDHFNTSEKRRFKTFYLQCLDFFQPNGPIYIHLIRRTFKGGDVIKINRTLISALTKETQGAMFVSQMRYFGDSTPPKSKVPADNHYEYLNISQTLADIVELIKYLKSKPEYQSSKVVLMGSLLEGNLATWMRAVYPNLVDAAIAATAPLLAKKDAKEYLEHTADIYDTYGRKNCINDIEERFQLFEDALKNASDLEFYKKKHAVCEFNNFTVIEDQQNYMLSHYWGYYYYASIGYLEGIQECEHFFLETNGCMNYHYDDLIKHMKHFITKMPEIYHSCLEFGQFLTSSAKKRPFVHLGLLEFNVKLCKDVFGIDEKRMDEGIALTNLRYGGITPNVTNVVFTNGELCPERMLGVQQNISDAAPAFLVEESDSYNILFIRRHDSQNIIEIRNRVKSLIKKWIGL